MEEKIEIVAEVEGRKRALAVKTETIPKTEWPAHDTTDAARLVQIWRHVGVNAVAATEAKRREISLCAGRPFTGVNGKKKSACSVRNDGVAA